MGRQIGPGGIEEEVKFGEENGGRLGPDFTKS